MDVAITVRDVPEDVRAELGVRAARAGRSVQECLRSMLIQSVDRPGVGDVIARARSRVEATGVRVGAESILAARDADRRRGHASLRRFRGGRGPAGCWS